MAPFCHPKSSENRSRRLSETSPGILGRSWPLLSRPWPLLQRPWTLFCRLWRSCAVLGRSWTIFGSILGSNLGVPGGSANRVFGHFCGYGTHLAPRPPPRAPRTSKSYHFGRFFVLSGPPKSQFLLISGASGLTQKAIFHDFESSFRARSRPLAVGRSGKFWHSSGHGGGMAEGNWISSKLRKTSTNNPSVRLFLFSD